MRRILCFLVAVAACKSEVPPTVTVPSAAPARAEAPAPSPAPPPAATAATAAGTTASGTCQSDADCVLSAFPGCCTCCECGKVHATTRSMDTANREACGRKDCPSCDQLDYKCIPCKDPEREGMRARCQQNACVRVDTAPVAGPPTISCQTTDDCWFDDKHQPIARPRSLRGKKITPCKDGGHAPACVDSACIVRAYKC